MNPRSTITYQSQRESKSAPSHGWHTLPAPSDECSISGGIPSVTRVCQQLFQCIFYAIEKSSVPKCCYLHCTCSENKLVH